MGKVRILASGLACLVVFVSSTAYAQFALPPVDEAGELFDDYQQKTREAEREAQQKAQLELEQKSQSGRAAALEKSQNTLSPLLLEGWIATGRTFTGGRLGEGKTVELAIRPWWEHWGLGFHWISNDELDDVNINAFLYCENQYGERSNANFCYQDVGERRWGYSFGIDAKYFWRDRADPWQPYVSLGMFQTTHVAVVQGAVDSKKYLKNTTGSTNAVSTQGVKTQSYDASLELGFVYRWRFLLVGAAIGDLKYQFNFGGVF